MRTYRWKVIINNKSSSKFIVGEVFVWILKVVVDFGGQFRSQRLEYGQRVAWNFTT